MRAPTPKSRAIHFANPGSPQFEDFGEIALRSEIAQGYIKVDWYTADALPNWGDGRLFITGTEGSIELRKYVDIAWRPGTDHLFVVNGSRCEHIDCADECLTYFDDLLLDVRNRTQTACPQSRTFRVCELASEVQAVAVRRGSLSI